jgi:predicted DNA-binding protein
MTAWYYRVVPTISLKVPDDIDARLTARSRSLGRSKSELTREALSRYLNEAAPAAKSGLDLVRDLVGSVRGQGDLASNKKHLRGYGR